MKDYGYVLCVQTCGSAYTAMSKTSQKCIYTGSILTHSTHNINNVL